MAGLPLAGNINVCLGRGDLPMATLTHACGATAEVYIYGAHVTSWKSADGVERLYVSSASEFARGKAIRGGIPVCFPQFSGRGSLPKHGFVRTSDQWEIESMSSEGGEPCLVLALKDSDETRAAWPHSFCARLTVRLAETGLATQFEVTNTASAPLSFTGALHTYFAVPDVAACRVTGLKGLRYEDNAAAGTVSTEEAEEVMLPGEVDRVYLDAPARVTVSGAAAAAAAAAEADGEGGAGEGGAGEGASATLLIEKEGFRDAVLWNIGGEKAQSMADLGAGEWRRYVCVEAGAIGELVSIEPGSTWVGKQLLSVVT